MTIVVCVRYTPDLETVRVHPTTGAPDLSGVQCRVDPLDEHALDAARRLRELLGDRVVALSVAAARPPDHVVLRTLAAGADEARLLCDPRLGDDDALAVTDALAAMTRRVGPVGDAVDEVRVVVAGAMSADACRGEIGGRLAEALGRLPVVSNVAGIGVRGDGLSLERREGPDAETVAVQLPAVLLVGGDGERPRLPGIRQIALAGRKPVLQEELAELPGAAARGQAGLRTVHVQAPPSDRKRILVTAADPDDYAARLLRSIEAEGVWSP